jgi:hypothetical protein
MALRLVHFKVTDKMRALSSKHAKVAFVEEVWHRESGEFYESLVFTTALRESTSCVDFLVRILGELNRECTPMNTNPIYLASENGISRI